ncbi:MAG: SDR family NAD(P)-dependent oxidoreductase [Rhodocyclaceae bacterium]
MTWPARPFAPLNRPIRDWRGLRVWIVGASSGIGAALARRLAHEGARLILSARSAERLAEIARDCTGALIETMDVTRPDDYARVRDRIVSALGGIDVVVLNAGTYAPLRAWELASAAGAGAAHAMLRTNLLGVIDGVAAVVPHLLERGQGAIAVVGSVAGYSGLPRAAVYGATKAALINFAEALYLDLRPRGVSVFLIDPGFVATPLTAGNDFHMPALIQPERAADDIVAGFARGAFEVHFPRRFTTVLKLLRCLPYRLYFAIVGRTTGT